MMFNYSGHFVHCSRRGSTCNLLHPHLSWSRQRQRVYSKRRLKIKKRSMRLMKTRRNKQGRIGRWQASLHISEIKKSRCIWLQEHFGIGRNMFFSYSWKPLCRQLSHFPWSTVNELVEKCAEKIHTFEGPVNEESQTSNWQECNGVKKQIVTLKFNCYMYLLINGQFW